MNHPCFLVVKIFPILYSVEGADAAALIGPPVAEWTQDINFLWPYGGCYMVLILFFIGAITVLAFTPLPPPPPPVDLAKLEPPRPLSQLFRVPRLLLALITATIGFGYVHESTQFSVLLKLLSTKNVEVKCVSEKYRLKTG